MTVQAILGNKGFEVISIEAEAKLSAAIRVLTERHVGAVLVMKDHHIEGILSERDVVRVLGKHGASILEMPVSEVMTRKVVTCRRADTAASIMEKMTNGKFRHLPVVEDGEVVGIVSIGDVVKARIEQVEFEADELRSYIATA